MLALLAASVFTQATHAEPALSRQSAAIVMPAFSKDSSASIKTGVPPTDLANFRSLAASSSHCVSFQWVADGGIERAAITIPVVVDGKMLRFQLDTGSPSTIVYVGNRGKSLTKERYADVRLGDVRFVGTPLIEDGTQSVGDDGIAGTFGLAPLIGRITIIDYPARRFCVFTDANQPTYSRQPRWINGAISEQKFLLPASVGDQHTRRVIFDTGSSMITLQLGLQDYLRATGLNDVAASIGNIGGNAWGKTIQFFRHKSRVEVSIGDYPFEKPDVFLNSAYQGYSIANDTRFTGVVGNALMWNKVIILDLTQRARFGILE